MFQFAVDVGPRAENTSADVQNRTCQRHRCRVLTTDKLALVWAAARAMAYKLRPYHRFVMLTGGRRGKWARACWYCLDSIHCRLVIPAEVYKTGKPQAVPLSDQVRAIITSLPYLETEPFLFSSNGGATPVSEFSKAEVRLDRIILDRLGCAMPSWVTLDLRRSMATHMEGIGIVPHINEVCLGHALQGIAGIYHEYGFLDKRAEALQRWANELSQVHGEQPWAPVILFEPR
jgi:integrase